MALRKCVIGADGAARYVDMSAQEEADFEASRVEAPARWRVPKALIVERLIAANKLADAVALIENNLANRERWRAQFDVWNDDQQAVNLCAALALDPAIILAKP